MDRSPTPRGRRGDEEALATLIATLSDEDGYVAENARDSLPYFGEAAVQPLIAVLTDRGAPLQARSLAAEALSDLESSEGTAAMLRLLKDPTEDIALRRALPIRAGYSHDAQALDPLLQIARDATADGEMRRMAVAGLGELGDERVSPTLSILALEEGDGRLRSAALSALTHFNPGFRAVWDQELQPLEADILRFLHERGAVCPREVPVDDVIEHFGADPRDDDARGWIDGSLLILSGTRFDYLSTTRGPVLIHATGTGVCLTSLGAARARDFAENRSR